MAIYGSNPSKSSWDFDKTYQNYSAADADKANILYGRHIYIMEADQNNHKAGIYQRTDSGYLYIGAIVPPIVDSIELAPPEVVRDGNSAEFINTPEGLKLKLTLQVLKDYGELTELQGSVLQSSTVPGQANTVKVYTTANPGSPTVPDNGFYITGDGVGITYTSSGTPRLTLSASPAWKDFD